MENKTLKLDDVLERLGVSLEQLKEVWNSGGALAVDWLHADSDGERNCMASIHLQGGDDRRKVFEFDGCDFLEQSENPKAIFGRLVLVESSGTMDVKGGFDDFCSLVEKIRRNPARYETGVPICAAFAIEEGTD